MERFPDDDDDRKSQKVLNELENIDDECDKLGIVFVKIDNDDEAKEYGIEKIPSLVYFENGIPTLYDGNLEDEDKVLKWFEHQIKSDEIEDVTDEMLDMIINKRQFVAVLFCKFDRRNDYIHDLVVSNISQCSLSCLFQMTRTKRRVRKC